MPFTLTMPKLSPTMEEGMISKWHKSVGDHVEAGELLLEVSTDKATIEYNALDSGWLRHIARQEGQSAKVNEPIAIFTEEQNEDIEESLKELEKKAQQAAELRVVKVDIKPAEALPKTSSAKPEPIKSPSQQEKPTPAAFSPPFTGKVMASPLAKKLAKEQGIDLSLIKGSGPGGRIVSKDLKNIDAHKGQTCSSKTRQDLPPIGHCEHEAMTPIRKVIAERLQEAKSTIPHFYVSQEIDAEPIASLREQLKAAGFGFTVNDLIVKATALALHNHPSVNSGFNAADKTIIRYKTIDIAVAVSIQGGLITPIIRYTDHKSLDEISQEVRSLVQKAKDGKLLPHEFQGGSFTISNLGMYGISDFQAIVNPPQAAILAVAGVQEVPVVKNGSIIPGKKMKVTLSCDHRVIDGADAADFLRTLKQIVENPIQLLLK